MNRRKFLGVGVAAVGASAIPVSLHGKVEPLPVVVGVDPGREVRTVVHLMGEAFTREQIRQLIAQMNESAMNGCRIIF